MHHRNAVIGFDEVDLPEEMILPPPQSQHRGGSLSDSDSEKSDDDDSRFCDAVDAVWAESDYEGSDEDELSFKRGDVICHFRQLGGGWGRGILKGKVGIFPLAHVEPTYR